MIREAWRIRFRACASHNARHLLTDLVMCQLSQCRSDEARRLILGVSHAYVSEAEGRKEAA